MPYTWTNGMIVTTRTVADDFNVLNAAIGRLHIDGASINVLWENGRMLTNVAADTLLVHLEPAFTPEMQELVGSKVVARQPDGQLTNMIGRVLRYWQMRGDFILPEPVYIVQVVLDLGGWIIFNAQGAVKVPG